MFYQAKYGYFGRSERSAFGLSAQAAFDCSLCLFKACRIRLRDTPLLVCDAPQY
jgi:hypothetical protein